MDFSNSNSSFRQLDAGELWDTHDIIQARLDAAVAAFDGSDHNDLIQTLTSLLAKIERELQRRRESVVQLH